VIAAMRVVIADEWPLLRAATARILGAEGFDVVAQAADAGDLLRKVRAHQPAVAVVDTRLPPAGRHEPSEAVRTIRAELPHVGVLVLSTGVDERYATALLDRGADGAGYVLEPRLSEIGRLSDAVRQVGAGGSALDSAVVTQMLGRRRACALDALGERDRDVLAAMATGATNRAIADRMFLSERAVERHVTTIFQRLGIEASRYTHRRVLAVLAYRCAR
jgi:DNA-binding NarL/FixJ family response regulator